MHVLIAVILSARVLLLPVSPAADPPPAVEDLAWMSGCWMQTRTDGFVEEHWMPPAGGTLIGMSRTVRGGKTTEHEFLQIRDVGGRLAYIANPSGQAENTFPLKTLTATEVIFEDPKHDFPQRVIYRRASDGSVTARIEGEIGGEPKGMEFPYQRCR